MLEDVAVAMELASQYAFELRAKRQSGHTRSPTPLPFPTTTNSGLSGLEQDLLLAFDSPQRPSPSSPVPPMPPSSYTTTTTNKHAGSQNSPLAMEVEFDEAQKRVRLLLEPAALDRLPPTLKAAMAESGGGGLVVPIVALLFCQGIDVHQSFANLSNQLKGKGDKEKEKELPASASAPPSSSSSSSSSATASSQPGGADSAAAGEEGRVARAGTGKGSKKVGGDSTIQPIINRRSLKILNDYCHRCHPVATSAASPAAAAAAFDRFAERFDNARAATAYGSQEEFVRSVNEIPALHPLLASLRDALRRDNGSHKNVELLREQERVVLELGGGQVSTVCALVSSWIKKWPAWDRDDLLHTTPSHPRHPTSTKPNRSSSASPGRTARAWPSPSTRPASLATATAAAPRRSAWAATPTPCGCTGRGF